MVRKTHPTYRMMSSLKAYSLGKMLLLLGCFFLTNLYTTCVAGKDYLRQDNRSLGIETLDDERFKYRRSALQLGSLLSVYTSGYLLRLDLSRPDFELDASGSGEYSNWTDFSYDVNYRYYNWGHVYAGVTYYQIARANGLSIIESMLANTLASALWEYAVEYREVFSIGDQVITTFGGLTLGEAMRQVASIFQSTRDRQSYVAALLDLPTAYNTWRRQGQLLRKMLGRYQHFDIFLSSVKIQSVQATDNYTAWQLGVDSRVINIKNFFNAGKQTSIIAHTTLTDLIAYTEFGNGVGLNYYTFAKNAYAGLWYKNISVTKQGKQGYYMLLAPASALEYRSRDYEQKRDWHGVINVLGASVNAGYIHSALKTSVSWGVFADFAMVRAYALDKYRAEHSIVGIRKVVRDRRYYYAYGYTQLWALGLEYKLFDLKLKWTKHGFNSLDNNNRLVQEQTQFLTYEDYYDAYSIDLRYRFGQQHVSLGFEQIYRRGLIENAAENFQVKDHSTENRVTIRYLYRY